ncbi:hypothetical protein ACFY04_41815 [Streptomyces sp. NPDC001549]|uniref:hypothetical protein n=1 Tax=Streptomyces sp. NPDC001549 TaxID=3364586 RepID=UPI0036A4D5D2
MRPAALLRRRAGEAAAFPDERWMVDQDEAGGLVLAAFVPEDIDPDGMVGGSVVAWFAYPGNPERATHARALGAASHTGLMQVRVTGSVTRPEGPVSS